MKRALLSIFILFAFGLTIQACGGKKIHTTLTGQEQDSVAFNKCLQLSSKKKFQEAINCLEVFKSRFSSSPYANEAEIKVADAYYQHKEYLLAAETYQMFARLHPTSDKLDYVYFRMGLSYLHESPKKIDRDQERLPQAIDSFAVVLSQYPSSTFYKAAKAKHDEARKRLAKRALYIGKFYYKEGEYKSAIVRFEEIYRDYPQLGLDEEVLYAMLLSHQRLGNMNQAKAILAEMQSKFPESKLTQKAAKKLT